MMATMKIHAGIFIFQVSLFLILKLFPDHFSFNYHFYFIQEERVIDILILIPSIALVLLVNFENLNSNLLYFILNVFLPK